MSSSDKEDQEAHQRRVEALGHFAAGIAHDFNNQLAAIMGLAGVIEAQLADGDPIRDDARQIVAAVERASRLTRQLLLFARRQAVAPRVVEPRHEIEALSAMLRRLLSRDIELQVSLPARLSRIVIDPVQLEQVIVNLVVNARDAMPRGGRIVIEGRNVDVDERGLANYASLPPGRYVELRVTDNGVGIEPHVRDRIFDPFFTTKGAGVGTGIGLATVQSIVRESKGAIFVDSVLGAGTTFRVVFPRAAVTSPLTVTSLSPPADLQGTETVLLVEDDEAVRAVVARILRKAGYTVLETASPGDALLTVEQHQGSIHLLITDVMLAQMRGPQLAGRIATIRPETRVLYMSGHAADGAVGDAPVPHAQFLPKPFAPNVLLLKVRAALT